MWKERYLIAAHFHFYYLRLMDNNTSLLNDVNPTVNILDG